MDAPNRDSPLPPSSTGKLGGLKLVFFSGKGGVGKTTVSLAYAFARAKQEKKVLFCLLSPTAAINRLFQVSSFSYIPRSVHPNVDIIEIDPRHSLEEYLSLQLHMKKLIKVMTHNSLVTHFLDAVPGLNEILVLGKIHALLKEAIEDPARGYDLIVVDSPATGHGLSLLQVPMVVKTAVKAGPLKTQAAAMIDLFSDPDRSALCLVTLAEDMPVQESVDFSEKIKAGFYLALGPVFLNAMLPPLPKLYAPFPEHLSFHAGRFYQSRLVLQDHYRKQVESKFETVIELPFLMHREMGISEIEQLAHEMESATHD